MAEFKKRSWLVILVLSLITLGIYPAYWFSNIKKQADSLSVSKRVNTILSSIFVLVAVLRFGLNIDLFGLVNTNYYNIGLYLNFVYAILYVVLCFSVRSVVIAKFNAKVNPVLTFFFGPLYLQHRINVLASISPMFGTNPPPEIAIEDMPPPIG
jgi:hypothetical protein